MTKKTNPRKDFIQIAFKVFQQATGEVEAPNEEFTGKKADSQKGGLKRGKAQAEKLMPEELSKQNDTVEAWRRATRFPNS